jgi:hypothetical protein
LGLERMLVAVEAVEAVGVVVVKHALHVLSELNMH